MPTYEYMCKKCGPFTQLRPMAECELPSACPECGARSPRVLLTAPGCLTMSADSASGRAQSTSASPTDCTTPPPYLRDPPGSTKKSKRAQRRESVSASLTESRVGRPGEFPSTLTRSSRSSPEHPLETRLRVETRCAIEATDQERPALPWRSPGQIWRAKLNTTAKRVRIHEA